MASPKDCYIWGGDEAYRNQVGDEGKLGEMRLVGWRIIILKQEIRRR